MKTRSLLGWTGLVFALSAPLTLNGAVDTFLKIATLKGESVDSVHKGETEVQSWNWNASNSIVISGNGGATTGKASFQPLTITKRIDSTSPGLLLAAMKGTQIGDTVLTLRKVTGDGPGTTAAKADYIKLELKAVYVTNITTSSDEEGPIETVQLTFGSFRLSYSPQNQDGTLGTPIQSSWNAINNTPNF